MGQIITPGTKNSALETILKENQRTKPWLRLNDASMIPDRGFRKQLKKLNKGFELLWNSVTCNWEIWDFPDTGLDPYMIMRVGKVGSYEELSQKILIQMRSNVFSANNLTTKAICDYLDEQDAQRKRRRELEFRQRLQDVALDTRAFLNGVLQVQVPRTMRIERSVADAR